jgi:hypothetical protein
MSRVGTCAVLISVVLFLRIDGHPSIAGGVPKLEVCEIALIAMNPLIHSTLYLQREGDTQ